jgi:hypothetical protein
MKKVFSINDNGRPNQYRIRWVLLYVDGTKKKGMWNESLKDCPFTCPSLQKQTGILVAQIECIDVNGVQKVAVECPGDCFSYFSWECYQTHTALVRGGTGLKTAPAVNYGLTLHDTMNSTTVTMAGFIEVNDPMPSTQDKLFKFGQG